MTMLIFHTEVVRKSFGSRMGAAGFAPFDMDCVS